jgi:DNA-binding transcriptional regulator LsrR (DeoR family)
MSRESEDAASVTQYLNLRNWNGGNHFFAGLQESEIAQELGVSEITVKRDWKFARAWLAIHLSPQGSR